MVNYEQAKRIILEKNKLGTINACLEFDNFYLFKINSIFSDSENILYSGTVYPAVSKIDGHVFNYDILSNPSKYKLAKKVIL